MDGKVKQKKKDERYPEHETKCDGILETEPYFIRRGYKIRDKVPDYGKSSRDKANFVPVPQISSLNSVNVIADTIFSTLPKNLVFR